MTRIDLDHSVIDLTGPAPRVLDVCALCHRPDELFRLMGTSAALCTACFGALHG